VIAARLKERAVGDGGYSLVEMLVTIIMFTLIAGSITTVVITSLKHQQSLADRGSALATLRNSLEQVDRDIRSADPLCYATGTEIAMLEQPQNGGSGVAIVDYSVQPDPNNSTIKDLVYTRYSNWSNTTPSGAVECITSVTLAGSATPTITDYWEAGPPTTTRTVIYGLTGNTSSIFTAPANPATFQNCITGGAAPTSTMPVSGGVKIPILAMTVSQQPASLHEPVTATDCGTFLRNENLPQ
jgi:type II secretory pathway component PulJ